METSEAKEKRGLRIESINPILNVKDMSVSRAFYVDILGFRNAEWGDDNFTCINRDNACIYLCRGGQGQPGTWLWVGFDGNIFELYDELKSKGVSIRQPPVKYSWALEMQVEDPDGNVLRFGTDPNSDESLPNSDRPLKI
jgi:catechol 2,3-dioxygenase-like lactoylglutathione lyase family enzyme